MHTDKTGKHVLGTSELTCLIPIRSGFIPNSLDTRTFATRLRIAVRLLNALRVSSREVHDVRPIVDSVDAIRGIYSFSFSVLQNRQLLMWVTFDKPWEAYMRIVWKDLGPVLDLILCNCEGYDLPSRAQGFERFVAWIRERQQESEFFYAPGSLTVDDQRYLADAERISRDLQPPAADVKLAALVAPDPTETAHHAAKTNPGEAVRQHVSLLSALFGLRELYLGEDEVFLKSAAHLLLGAFKPDDVPAPLRHALARELEWFATLKPAVGSPVERPRPDDGDLQGGVLEAYRRMTHGCLLLMRIVDAAQARTFVGGLADKVMTRKAQSSGVLAINVAFTQSGLKRLGVSEIDLGRFPKEFREGMAARAGLLGDVRGNHPDNWTLPEWNWPKPHRPVARVRLSSVDVVITVRAKCDYADGNSHVWSENHPLFSDIAALADEPGIQLLSVLPMCHYRDAEHHVREHFGFVDGISQPIVDAVAGQHWDDGVPIGDLILGHGNSRNDPPFPAAGTAGRVGQWEQGSLLDNGTFLVVRKLRQYVDRLNHIADSASEVGPPGVVVGKMVGRTRDGHALANTSNGQHPNDFDYRSDASGNLCPLQAHVRRANPRTGSDATPIPRIARRGMAYGPRFVANDDEDRGMVFLAYNASIAEQFEVVQRWMTGGNSTGIFSGQADPLLRVPDAGEAGTMRIPQDKGAARITLGDESLVTLQWGMYLFAPSIRGLRQLAVEPAFDPRLSGAQIALGLQVMGTLRTIEEWSGAMEDVTASRSGVTSAILATIRAVHGGALRTPYGVLVASKALVDQVLSNDAAYSVKEYRARMLLSVGDGYLGLDQGPAYAQQSAAPNRIVHDVTRRQAFDVAVAAMGAALNQVVASQDNPATAEREAATVRLEQVVDAVLAELCALWFGVPDGTIIRKGGRPTPPGPTVHLPFHSLSPSRYVFSSPQPRTAVVGLGQAHGTQLLTAVRAFVATARNQPAGPGSLLPRLMDAIPDDNLLAHTIVGMVEGFLPTVYGNMLKTLNLWLTDETLWRVQQDLLMAAGDAFDRAERVIGPALVQAMHSRPVPDMIYRTATRSATLGQVQIEPGDRVVISIVSVVEQAAAQHSADVSPVFGGRRSDPTHPTHACPALEMGMGVMMGMLAALLEKGSLQPTAANLVVKLG